jgi:peptidyl-prolyl cis-trans isomerase D
MIKILRKHRNWLMIVIAILALPFCIYFVKTDPGAMRSDQFARVYNRNVSLIEAKRNARLFDLARQLGQSEFLRDLTSGATSQGDVYTQFILNLLILRRESETLGIRPTSAEIVDVVRDFPAFRGAQGFDINKYNEFTQNALSPAGFGEDQIEELARDQLCLDRIKQLLATAIATPESEIRENYDQAYGKMFVSVVRLHSADFAKDVKITDDDVRKYYEAHKAELKTEEKRKVEFVSLSLTDEQKKLTGKERIEALQKLADRANDFSQALLEKGAIFQQVAAKFQLPVQATGEFTAAAPDPQLKADRQLGAAAFKLTAQEPNSDPIQGADGFYILHLTSVVEARPMTAEEAKPKVTETIKNSRTHEMISTKGAEIVNQLREAIKSGQSLEATAQKMGAKAERIEPFSLLEDPAEKPENKKEPKNEPPDFNAIKGAASQLKPGDVSDFVPSQDGGIIAVLEKREPPDEAKYQAGKAAFEERILRNKREIVFFEWLRDRQAKADVKFPTG